MSTVFNILKKKSQNSLSAIKYKHDEKINHIKDKAIIMTRTLQHLYSKKFVKTFVYEFGFDILAKMLIMQNSHEGSIYDVMYLVYIKLWFDSYRLFYNFWESEAFHIMVPLMLVSLLMNNPYFNSLVLMDITLKIFIPVNEEEAESVKAFASNLKIGYLLLLIFTFTPISLLYFEQCNKADVPVFISVVYFARIVILSFNTVIWNVFLKSMTHFYFILLKFVNENKGKKPLEKESKVPEEINTDDDEEERESKHESDSDRTSESGILKNDNGYSLDDIVQGNVIFKSVFDFEEIEEFNAFPDNQGLTTDTKKDEDDQVTDGDNETSEYSGKMSYHLPPGLLDD